MPIIIAIIAVIFVGGAVYLFSSSPDTNVPTPVTVNTVRREDQTETEPTVEAESTTDSGSIDTTIEANSPDDQAQTNVTTETGLDVPITTPTTEALAATRQASATYLTPARTSHEITVSLTLAESIVTDADVVYDGKVEGYSTPNQERFDGAFKAEVIGKPIDSISLSRVGGASLTSSAFNEAVAKIAAQI